MKTKLESLSSIKALSEDKTSKIIGGVIPPEAYSQQASSTREGTNGESTDTYVATVDDTGKIIG